MHLKGFLHCPQSTAARRALFQVHVWVGVLAGLYVFIVCTTGAALIFRIDLQRALHPELFTAGAGPQADAATILERLREAYPDGRISGIDAPTTARPTYLAYVVRGGRLLTLLVDPAGGSILGELPERSFVRTLQDLHFDLLAGRTGRVINGIGAGLLLALCLTGIVIWWPGVANWRRGFLVDVSRPWRRVIWDLHGAMGISSVALLAMWAVTGLYFAFPSQFRATVNTVFPLSVTRTPRSDPASGAASLAWRTLIARAQEQMPGQYVQRVIPPADASAPFLVMFSPVRPAPVGRESLATVYLDQYTGQRLAAGKTPSTAGDAIVRWMGPLHVGNFGGPVIRAAWLIFGLAPPVLVVTGFLMWWTRVVRPRWLAFRRDRPQASVEAPAQP